MTTKSVITKGSSTIGRAHSVLKAHSGDGGHVPSVSQRGKVDGGHVPSVVQNNTTKSNHSIGGLPSLSAECGSHRSFDEKILEMQKRNSIEDGIDGCVPFDSSVSEIHSLEILEVNNVTMGDTSKRLRRIGSGKVVVGSGAAESVMPWQMLPEEPLMPSSKSGAKYVDASGHQMSNKGQKELKMLVGGKLRSMTFQATDVKKPWPRSAGLCRKAIRWLSMSKIATSLTRRPERRPGEWHVCHQRRILDPVRESGCIE